MNRFDPAINTIHCDMDGVLVDFDGSVEALTGHKFSNYTNAKHDRMVWNLLLGVDRLFYQMGPTEYAKRLWNEIKFVGCDRRILTALPHGASVPTAHDDKIDWVQGKHRDIFGEWVPVHTGPYRTDKWRHAKPGDILIDDDRDNIIQWVALGGGIGIYHHEHDIERTLKLLAHYTGQ